MVKPTHFELADRLVLATIRLTRTLRAGGRVSGLTGPQISALAVIVYSRRIAAKDLASMEEVTPGAMSRVIHALEQAELVGRTPDDEDRRIQWISATPRGKRIIEKGHRRRLQPLAEVMAALPPEEERTALMAIELIENLTKAVAAGK